MTSKSVNNDVEILRAVAVLAVILHHAIGNLLLVYPEYLREFHRLFNGGAGVDLFFVISGYVIGLSFLPMMDESSPYSKKQVVQSFWVRRIFRIFPLAWFWLCVLLISSLLFNNSGAFGSIKANVDGTIYAVFQIANYRFEQCFMRYECGPSFVYWSLSLEEQFYIVLPILAYIFRQYLVYILAVTLIYKLTSTSLSYYFGFRFEGLIFGVLLAMATQHKVYYKLGEIFSKINTNVIRLVQWLLLFALFYQPFIDIGIHKFKLMAVISTLVVLIASYRMSSLLSSGGLRSVAIWIGSRSFALYLVHIPAFLFVREISFRLFASEQPDSVFLLVAAAIMIMIFFVESSYRYIETPFREKGVLISKAILKAS